SKRPPNSARTPASIASVFAVRPILKEHAWKLTPLARADSYQIPPTHFRSTTSRNIDTRRRAPVNDSVCPGFEGVCDTVLTQCGRRFTPMNIDAHRETTKCSEQRTWIRTSRRCRVLRSDIQQGPTGRRGRRYVGATYEIAVRIRIHVDGRTSPSDQRLVSSHFSETTILPFARPAST